jgi:haloacetate dehalogenase
MESVKRRTVTANGIRQHYIDAGQGPAVVLLHGFPFTNYTWRNQIPELSKKYRVIAPDLRGYGETDKPITGYDKRNMAKDLRELMRALKIDKIALVGHDRGARVATRFAKDHPDAIDRLVVVDNVPTRIVARDFNFSKMAKTYWLFLNGATIHIQYPAMHSIRMFAPTAVRGPCGARSPTTEQARMIWPRITMTPK